MITRDIEWANIMFAFEQVTHLWFIYPFRNDLDVFRASNAIVRLAF